jgi:DNA polymerase-3 subunit alpha
VTKNGKNWATFILEDYEESYEFRMFGEEYLKFRHLLMINGFIFCKVYIKEGWVNKNTGEKTDHRLQFNSIQLLQEVLEKNSKKLTISMNLNEMEETRIDLLKSLLKEHPGTHTLDFYFYEPEENIKLQTKSRKHKIKISQELLGALEKQNFYYMLN